MLTLNEIRDKIQRPENGVAIQRGRIHSQRLKFHSDMQVIAGDLSATYLSTFKAWVNELLPSEKYDTFCSLILTPLHTNELTESIYNNLHRVFDGKNKSCRLEMKNPDREADFDEFFDRDSFREKVFEVMKSDIDSVIVCDLPSLQEGEFPDPYFYFVGSDSLIDIEVEDGEVEYVIFQTGENEYVTVDKEFWRKTDRDGKLLTEEREDDEPPEPVEVAHGLGYCPARMVWSDPLASGNEVNKKSPLTSVLGDLDRLLFNYIAKDYADLYAGFPIMVSYEADEDVKGNPGEDHHTKTSKSKGLLGPGTHYTVTPPVTQGDPDLNSNPIQVIGGDVPTLEYITAKNAAARQAIFKAVVGTDGEFKNDAAKNEKQIEAGFESKLDVLMNLKRNFEAIEDWAVRTLATLRYGEDQVIECHTDLGTDFYLYDESDILSDITTAKENNAPDTVVAVLTDKYMEAAYRSDPQMAQRMRIIRDLDPLPNMSITDAVSMAAYLPTEDLKLKVSMDALIARFERENPVGLIGFGSGADYKRKIETINETLRGYVRETDPGQQAPGNPGE